MTQIPFKSKQTFQEVGQFVKTITALVSEGNQSICIDMSACQYMNSIMLSGLIRALKICQDNSCEMVLSQVSTSVLSLFETTNVLSLFTMINPEDAQNQSESLDLSFEKRAGTLGLLGLQGSLNSIDQCTQFRSFYENHLVNFSHCILDCSELSHIGTQGVTELFRLRGILHEKSGRLVIVSTADSVDSIWRMMHLESLIPRTASIQEAESLLEKPPFSG